MKNYTIALFVYQLCRIEIRYTERFASPPFYFGIIIQPLHTFELPARSVYTLRWVSFIFEAVIYLIVSLLIRTLLISVRFIVLDIHGLFPYEAVYYDLPWYIIYH